MQGGVSEAPNVGMSWWMAAFLSINRDIVIFIFLRLDNDGPAGWKSRVMDVQIIRLEREACENWRDGKGVSIR